MWLARKDAKLKAAREKQIDDEIEPCTWYPETLDYFPEAMPKKESKFKIVFGGNTYDLTSESDLQDFFLSSITKKRHLQSQSIKIFIDES
jgi:hypothetical protein